MKKILQILILLICLSSINDIIGQQKFKIKTVKNDRLTKVLNNSQLIGENRENWVSVRIYKLDNGSGSADNESCGVTFNLLIAVSGFDENPEQNLFEIGPFYNPDFQKWTELKDYEKTFEINYGGFDERKTIKLKVNLKELKLIDKIKSQ